MSESLSAFFYLVASICFIMALRGLSSPETARGGNLYGIAGMVIAVATDGDELVGSLADHVLWIPDCPWMLAPVLTVLPLQLLAYHIAIRRGCDVDQPRNLAKSVTVE